jgi:hypothetical protein
MMTLNLPSPTYVAFADFLLEKLPPEEILAFKASEAEQEYVRELIERNNAGTLTAEERDEVEQMLQFERMMSVLKARALLALKKP